MRERERKTKCIRIQNEKKIEKEKWNKTIKKEKKT